MPAPALAAVIPAPSREPATLLLLAGALVLLYLAFLGVLVLLGRRGEARAWAGFVPDCVVLVTRLMRDPRTPARHRVALALLAVYLASPLDLVPDVIPVAGQLDDAILVALVLGRVLRAGGRERLEEHWPGPVESREVVARLCRLR